MGFRQGYDWRSSSHHRWTGTNRICSPGPAGAGGSIQGIERVPEDLKRLYKTAFEIEPTWLLQCAAVRQKWLDQSQSVNLFLAENDARLASFMYREAWERGLKTTYYLRTINKSGIDSGNRERRKSEPEPIVAAAACSIDAALNRTICESCQ